MLVNYVSIQHFDNNEYTTDYQTEILDSNDFFNALDGEVYELGLDDLPANVTDIRNSIHNEPDQVFAYISGEGEEVSYFGLSPAE